MTNAAQFERLCEQRRAAERRRDALVVVLMPSIEPGAEWTRIGPNHPALAEFDEVSKEIDRLDIELRTAETLH